MNIRQCTCVLAVGGVFAVLSAGVLASDTKSDEDKIRAAYASITKAYEVGDAAGAMAPYVKDDRLVVFDIPPPLSVPGYAANLRSTKEIMEVSVLPCLVEYKDLHITVDHNHAYTRFFVHVRNELKESGQVIEFTARGTGVWERQKDGAWLIVLEHGSIPVNVGTGKPDFNAPVTGDSAVKYTTK
jgi:ketosteroid isomerase-like protein